MKECSKRQHENYKGTDRDRCINQQASAYLQIVTENICDSCPVRVVASQPVCKRPDVQARALPKDIKSVYVGQYEDMPHLKILNSHADYPDCPYRHLKAEGLICEVTGLSVTPEICKRCHAETKIESKKQEAKMGKKALNYFEAIRKWVAAGRPTRTKEEIEKLFNEHCRGCDRYDSENHACKNCGCAVAVEGSPLGNKLAMATEHCPLGRF